eukprot:TRINITY_DN39635_c0_g1_i3.p1 TRINITY_DN39635_c0_g1~~TRINITY_DN39635_c0_g1_i3.p1  ORF type:complete len:1425 (-),score=196.13 TRINITY_DN39635_c0_g1_i3:67-4341(-)
MLQTSASGNGQEKHFKILFAPPSDASERQRHDGSPAAGPTGAAETRTSAQAAAETRRMPKNVVKQDSESATYWEVVEKLVSGHGHHGFVQAASWMHDAAHGERIVTGGSDALAFVWRRGAEASEHFHIVAQLKGHRAAVTAVRWSPDGSTVLSGSADASAALWKAPTMRGVHLGHDYQGGTEWECSQYLEGHTDSVVDVAWAADASCLVLSSDDSTASVWDFSAQRPSTKPYVRSALLPHDRCVKRACFWPAKAGREILTSSEDGKVRRWTTKGEAGSREPWKLTVVVERSGPAASAATWSVSGSCAVLPADHADSLQVWRLEKLGWTGKDHLMEHTGQVDVAAWSPTGLQLASGGSDKTVRVWTFQASSGALGRVYSSPLRSHTDHITALEWSPKGDFILTASRDKSLLIWTARRPDAGWHPITGRLEGHAESVRSVAWSKDGRTVLTGSCDARVQLWQASPSSLTVWHVAGTLDGHTDSVRSLCISKDGSKLLTSSMDWTSRVWLASGEFPSWEQVAVLRGHTDAVLSGAWAKDGRRAITGSLDMTAIIWVVNEFDVSRWTIAGRLKDVFDGAVRAVAWSTDGLRILAASSDASIYIWSVSGGSRACMFEPLYKLVGHEDAILAVAWHPETDLVLTGSADWSVRVWNATVDDRLSRMRGRYCDDEMTSAGFPLKDAEAGEHGPLRQDAMVLQGHEAPVRAVAWVPHKKRSVAVTGGSDATVRLWVSSISDPNQWTLWVTLRGFDDSIRAVESAPDGGRIVCGCNDGVAHVYYLGSLLSDASASSSENLGQSAFLGTFSSKPRAVAWSPLDGAVAVGCQDGRLLMWQMLTPGFEAGWTCKAATSAGQHGAINALKWSADGCLLAVGSSDNTVALYDHSWPAYADLKPTAILRGHADIVKVVAWAPADSTLASAGADRTVRIWRWKEDLPRVTSAHGEGVLRQLWTCVAVLGYRHDITDSLNALAWLSDARTLISGCANSMIHVWTYGTGESEAWDMTLKLECPGPVADIAVNDGDPKLLATACTHESDIVIWQHRPTERLGWAMIASLDGHTEGMLAVAWSPDGYKLAAASRDCTASVWHISGDCSHWHFVASLVCHGGYIFDLAWEGRSEALATASADGTVHLQGVKWSCCSNMVAVKLRFELAPVHQQLFGFEPELVHGFADVRMYVTPAIGEEPKEVARTRVSAQELPVEREVQVKTSVKMGGEAIGKKLHLQVGGTLLPYRGETVPIQDAGMLLKLRLVSHSPRITVRLRAMDMYDKSLKGLSTLVLSFYDEEADLESGVALQPAAAAIFDAKELPKTVELVAEPGVWNFGSIYHAMKKGSMSVNIETGSLQTASGQKVGGITHGDEVELPLVCRQLRIRLLGEETLSGTAWLKLYLSDKENPKLGEAIAASKLVDLKAGQLPLDVLPRLIEYRCDDLL